MAACSRPENTVSPGVVEGLNNEVRFIQGRACGLRDGAHLPPEIPTCRHPAL